MLIKKLFLSILLVTGVFLVGDFKVFAVDCPTTTTANVATLNTSCTFPASNDGIDAGSGEGTDANVAQLDITGGATLTLLPNQTIAVGKITLTSGSIIQLGNGASIKIGMPLWYVDNDNDTYRGVTKQFSFTRPTATAKRASELTGGPGQLDCNDNDAAIKPGFQCFVSWAGSCGRTGYNCTGTEAGTPYVCNGATANCEANGSTSRGCNVPAGNLCRPSAGTCDVLENCNGSGSCPTDVFLSGQQSCGACKYCGGSSANCSNVASGADTYNNCTASYNACSGNNRIGPDGNCNGSGACNTTGLSSACATAGTCQSGGGCSGGSCVAVTNVTAGTDPYNQCTASYNACSGNNRIGPDGNCNGSGACNTSGLSVSCDDGNICTTDSCSNGVCSNVNNTVLCRASAGACDVAENCSGGSCPTDSGRGTAYTCAYGSYTGANGACQATRTNTYCSAADRSTCTGATWTEYQYAPVAGNVWWTNSWQANSGSIYCTAATATSCSGQQPQGPVKGCALGSNNCNVNGTVVNVGAACGGGENARCVNGVCSNLCSNTLDDDGDGYIDGQDSNCGGCQQCTSGVCCNTTTGCYLSGTTCRSSAGVCDIAETCTGSSNACPANSYAANGTVCATESGGCEANDTCNGSGTCTENYATAGTTCRSSTGTCDLAETCSGSVGTCPADTTYASGATVCRSSTGTCDLAENCTGSSNTCPADTTYASGATQCRAAGANPTCDPAENCTGSSNTCPANSYAANGTVCATESGGCEANDTCNGSGTCTENYASGTTCRSSTNSCDPAETCPGNLPSCPSDTNNGPPITVYRDADGDTYGTSGTTSYYCTVGGSMPAGYVSNASDCYDANANAKPGQCTHFSVHRGDGSFDYDCYDWPYCHSSCPASDGCGHNAYGDPDYEYPRVWLGGCYSKAASCGETNKWHTYAGWRGPDGFTFPTCGTTAQYCQLVSCAASCWTNCISYTVKCK